MTIPDRFVTDVKMLLISLKLKEQKAKLKEMRDEK